MIRGHSSYPSAVGEDIRHEITVGPDEFLTHVDFEIGVGLCFVTCTLLAFDADGETIGGGSGELAADIRAVTTDDDALLLTADATNVRQNLGGNVAWLDDLPYGPAAPTGVPVGTPLPVRTHRRAGASWGIVRVVATLMDGNSFAEYAGPNHPTATWRVDIVRR